MKLHFFVNKIYRVSTLDALGKICFSEEATKDNGVPMFTQMMKEEENFEKLLI